MDLLVIGGTGFWEVAINFLLNNTYEIDSITIAGRSAKKFKNLNTQYNSIKKSVFETIDILDNLDDLNGNFTHIIHAATDSTNVSHLSYMDRYNQIVNGTICVLDFVRKKKP